jgi:hypothetical protein
MANFRDTISSFLGGISQQTSALRPNNVVDDVVNMEALPTEGLTKRYPSVYLADLKAYNGTPLDLTGYGFYSMERDDADYIIALGDGKVYAWESDGTAVEILDALDVATNSLNYLVATDAKDIRTQQIADSLFFVNRDQTARGLAGVDYPTWYTDNPGAGVAILQGGFAIDFTMKIKTTAMSATKTISYKSGGSKDYSAYVDTIRVKTTKLTGAVGDFNDSTLATRGWFFVNTLHVNERDTTWPQASTASGWNYRLFPRSVQDVEFYYAANGTSPGATQFPPDTAYYTEIPREDFVMDAETGAFKYIGSDATVLATDAWFLRQSDQFAAAFGASASGIARKIIWELKSHFDGSSADRPLVTIEGNDMGDPAVKTDTSFDPQQDFSSNAFRVYFTQVGVDDPIENWTIQDGEGGAFSSAWQDEVEDVTKLPAYWKNGAVIKLLGSTSSVSDDEYVQFVADDDEDFGRGIWREAAAPGLATGALDADTMPHQLERFYDGVTPKFRLQSLDWGGRQVGDETSSKEPSFVDQRIFDIFFHENRLGFVAGSNLVMSQSGEVLNFWRTTLTGVPASDPIDVSLSNLDGNTAYHAQSFDSRLIVSSQNAQASVQSDGALSPSTIEAPVSSRFRMSPIVSPVTQGRSLFFAFATGDYMQLRQMVPGQYVSDYQDAMVTVAVPQLIPNTARKIVPNATGDALLVLDEGSDTVYVYQYLTNGGESAMNAWLKWQFVGSVVIDAVTVGDNIYLVMERDGETHMERILFGAGRGDQTLNFRPRLDRQSGDITGTYDYGTDLTTFTVPFDFTVSEEISIALNDGGDEQGSVYVADTTDPALLEIYFQGDLSGAAYIAGVAYESRVEMSRPLFKVPSQRGGMHSAVGGRQLVRDLTMYLSDTGYCKATVSTLSGDDTEEEFLGEVLGVGEIPESPLRTGEWRIPIHANVDEFSLTLTNSSGFPNTIVTGAWTIRWMQKKHQR